MTEREVATMRPYAPSDLAACLSIFDSNVPDFFRPHEREEFEAFLAKLPGPYFVLQDDAGATVGCGGYAVIDAAADLCWGMVHREHHGRGLGRALTELRLGEIRANAEVRRVALHTSQHTVPFYQRLGFRETRVVPDGYALGLHRHDMRLDLVGR